MTTAADLMADVQAQPDLSAGLCVGDPELWSAPDDPGMTERAIALCLSCPVFQACSDWAATLPEGAVHGVVGGRVHEWLSPNQRWRRRRAA
ncbi:WhiB family transcriptional regulator [Mycobacterium sp. 852002-40037_SCH5390672]|uniref:WhiB family transcriptional regulator n=1 Tax=Mycobacterium sp. 852002-40037_SCH5390672 TaxID=1834089 RepID=UPI0008051D2B|nr:WhiB family transcriptional regulator [Mycobacterium sp. 852002-40037_SCH5390672]OBB95917.1 hypothetical protein A5782_05585 [Mycobacterium sp. 852002-40037_SCH5390672]